MHTEQKDYAWLKELVTLVQEESGGQSTVERWKKGGGSVG